jgi:hypothetical protein
MVLMNKQITLSEQEAQIVMQCLDIATKQGGLNAAATIIPIATSIQRQLTEDAPLTPSE